MKISKVEKGLLSDSVQVVILRVLGAVVTFLLTALIARKAGLSNSGVYFFCISFLSFLAAIASFGLQNSALKLVAIEASENRNNWKFFAQCIALVSATALFIAVCLNIFNYFFQHEIISNNTSYILMAIWPFSVLLLMSAFYQGLRMVKLSMITLNLGYQIIILLVMLFWKDTFSSNELLSLLTYSLFAICLFNLTYLYIYFFKDNRTSSVVPWKSIVALSFPFWVTQVAGQLNNFSGQFLLSIFTNEQVIGLFAVATRIAILLSLVVMAVNRVIAPKLAVLFKQNKISELVTLIKLFNRVILLCSFITLLLLFVFAEDVLKIFGQEFIVGKSLLLIVIVGQFVASITGVFIFLLQMSGFHKEVRDLVIISVILSIVMGLVLIPIFGGVGAASMYAFNLSFIGVGAALMVKVKLKLNLLKLY